jgi:hypothetical protein
VAQWRSGWFDLRWARTCLTAFSFIWSTPTGTESGRAQVQYVPPCTSNAASSRGLGDATCRRRWAKAGLGGEGDAPGFPWRRTGCKHDGIANQNGCNQIWPVFCQPEAALARPGRHGALDRAGGQAEKALRRWLACVRQSSRRGTHPLWSSVYARSSQLVLRIQHKLRPHDTPARRHSVVAVDTPLDPFNNAPVHHLGSGAQQTNRTRPSLSCWRRRRA